MSGQTIGAAARPLAPAIPAERTVMAVLLAISFSHMLNDLMQSLLPAIYPVLKTKFDLSFGQIGLLTLTFQITASLLQPLVGLYTDRRPLPFSLPVGMGFTLVGLLMLSQAPNFPMLLLAAAMVGLGSSVFHPESSRVARMASGGRHGFAQSLFQVGGNGGQAIGPLLAAFVVVPHGQGSVAVFALVALVGMVVLSGVGRWYRARIAGRGRAAKRVIAQHDLPPRRVAWSVAILLVLMFSKYVYVASFNSYYTFYLIDRFHVPVQTAQVYLFVYLGAFAAGTLVGGPVGDRIGRKYVIWMSILGVLPFTLALPYMNLFWTVALTLPIGLILASAFSAILVFAQELMPGRVGAVSGLFFGFAFGIAGVGAAVLGQVADHSGVATVYHICSFLPAIGLLTAFLPKLEPAHRAA